MINHNKSHIKALCFLAAFFVFSGVLAAEENLAEKTHKPRIHKVWIWQENGDCLWSIAKKYYGDPWRWKEIYLANKDKIKDPRVIYPKQKLVIPD